MNTFFSFILSKDGIITIAGIILFSILIHFTDPYHPWINLLGRVGNFSIFLYILWRATGKKIIQFFSQQKNNIIHKLQILELQKNEVEKNLAAIQERMALLSAEQEAIHEESRIQAEKLKKYMFNETQKEIEHIHKQTQKIIETESKEIAYNLRAQLADQIISKTEEELKHQLDMASHFKLIDNALTKVVLH